jgi:hypothetical protein
MTVSSPQEEDADAHRLWCHPFAPRDRFRSLGRIVFYLLAMDAGGHGRTTEEACQANSVPGKNTPRERKFSSNNGNGGRRRNGPAGM